MAEEAAVGCHCDVVASPMRKPSAQEPACQQQVRPPRASPISNRPRLLIKNKSDHRCVPSVSPRTAIPSQFSSGKSSSFYAPSKYAVLFTTTACAFPLLLARDFIRHEIGPWNPALINVHTSAGACMLEMPLVPYYGTNNNAI